MSYRSGALIELQGEGTEGQKTTKKCEYEKESKALFVGVIQQRDKGMPKTGPILQEETDFPK